MIVLRKYKVGVIQLNTQSDLDKNLETIGNLVEEAAQNGAKLISLPENMDQIAKDKEDYVVDEIPGKTINFMMELAKKHKLWIHCGSIKEYNKNGKPFNTTVMLNPDGEIVSKYSKLHLFDVDLDISGSFKESDNNSPGSEIVNIETEVGNLGFTICYDIRFPELFRLLTLNGAEVIFVPANFTYQTGKAHWSTLLRARAIENGVYIIACGQCGQKPKVLAYGHSMIVDPWGTVLAEAEEEEGIIYAEIDLDYINKVRSEVPSLSNRRADIYDLIIKKD
ncbi:MAG: carbon-nitrogen hydrolase family protein [Tissierellia bacterium]|jgi:predicted amidohydrolase|nr:carbon-nitrogen hydrolase family protein [Tissierellia bacterium]